MQNNPPSGQNIRPIGQSRAGLKQKPFKEAATSQASSIASNVRPKLTKKQIHLLKTETDPVITLVGKQKVNIASQQKKILKFQMRMQTMQQEKLRQAKTIQPIPKDKNHPKILTTNIEVPKTDMPNSSRMVSTPDGFNYSSWDFIGYKYPKGVAGIPKSFLIQQEKDFMLQLQQQQQQVSTSSQDQQDSPAWACQQSNQNLNEESSLLTDDPTDVQQPYSPSELYTDFEQPVQDVDEESDSQSSKKRLSVFRRLGPQKQPKKPKLTINLTVNEDQEVREVVDETEEQEGITPVHLRQELILSTDDTVMKHLRSWPWKKNVVVKKSVTARNSKTVMMLEREQMEEIYNRDSIFIQVTVKDYPPTWTKEQVLDLLMENIRGYSFIPCFIEFNPQECKFLTLRCRSALLSLHKCGFVIRKDDIQMVITISQTDLTLNHLDFIPRLVLRKRLLMCADRENKLNLSEFTLKEDISHFIYFPLNRLNNQSELIQMQSDVNWYNLTHLILSRNRITSLDGFDLEQTTPNLKHLDLSYNYLDKITLLLKCRELPLKSIHLEGNPLCTNYTDPNEYVKVVKMMFSQVTMIDDLPVKLKGDMPKFIRNYCPLDAKELVDKFLEIYFPLLDGSIEHRAMLEDMYEENANMSITYHYKLVFGPIYRCFKTLFQNARELEQGNMTIVKGSKAIIKSIASWPHTEHDPFSFTVDVLYHNDSTTIVRIDGILKLTRESLAEDEHLLAFSRTLVLHTRDFAEYKIQTEMIYWSLPTGPYAKSAFTVTSVHTKQMNPKIDSTTDEKLQGELLKIFMQLTSMDKKDSERCLEMKKWHLKEALDHFIKLLKLDSLELTKENS